MVNTIEMIRKIKYMFQNENKEPQIDHSGEQCFFARKLAINQNQNIL